MRPLFLLGGLRIGDCFHTVPFLNELVKKYPNLLWCAGKYEEVVVRYLCRVYNIECKILPDGFPGDLKSREIFRDAVKEQTDLSEFSPIIDDVCNSFDVGGGKHSLLPLTPPKKGSPYVVIHSHSISEGKDVSFLNRLKLSCPIYLLGRGDEVVPEGYVDFRNRPFEDVANLIMGSSVFIGIHSAMTCFSFYLPGVSAIVCHFAPSGLLEFGKHRTDWVDLKEPTEALVYKILKEKYGII